MTTDDFLRLGEAEVAKRGDAVRALWWEAQGKWDIAHEFAQKVEGESAGDWVHAYLHRVEGDGPNAGYWYARAGRRAPAPGTPFAEERAAILAELWRE